MTAFGAKRTLSLHDCDTPTAVSGPLVWSSRLDAILRCDIVPIQTDRIAEGGEP
jgi:hypothetical protein